MARELHYPRYSNFFRGGPGAYKKYLKDEIQQGAPGVEEYYRNQMFQDIGANQMQANEQVRRATTGGFGMNAPTGLTSALMAQNQLRSDYGGANLTATRMQQQRMRELGGELTGLKQKQANWYATGIAPWVQYDMGLRQLGLNRDIAVLNASVAAGS